MSSPRASSSSREKRLDFAPESSHFSRLGASSRGNGEAAGDDDAGWATDAQPPRNPFLRGLWVIGVALIVGGVWLTWWAMSNQNRSSYSGQGEMPVEMILQQLTWMLAPAMLSTGLLVIVGLIFERAIRWQRDRRAAS